MNIAMWTIILIVLGAALPGAIIYLVLKLANLIDEADREGRDS